MQVSTHKLSISYEQSRTTYKTTVEGVQEICNELGAILKNRNGNQAAKKFTDFVKLHAKKFEPFNTIEMKQAITDFLDATVNNIDSGEKVGQAMIDAQKVQEHLGGSLNEHKDAIAETLNGLEGLDAQGAFAAPIAKGREAVAQNDWALGREAIQDARDILAQMPD